MAAISIIKTMTKMTRVMTEDIVKDEPMLEHSGVMYRLAWFIADMVYIRLRLRYFLNYSLVLN